MDLNLLSAILAAGAAGAGIGTCLRLLPFRRDLRDYARSIAGEGRQPLADHDGQRQLTSHPEGWLRRTSIIGLDGNTIRHQDGSFSRLYEFELPETMLTQD